MSAATWAWWGVLMASASISMVLAVTFMGFYIAGKKPMNHTDRLNWAYAAPLSMLGYENTIVYSGVIVNVLSFIYLFFFASEDGASSLLNIAAFSARPVQHTFTAMIYGFLLVQYSTIQKALNMFISADTMYKTNTPTFMRLFFLVAIAFGYGYSASYKSYDTTAAMSYVQDGTLLLIAAASGMLSFVHWKEVKRSTVVNGEMTTRMFCFVNMVMQFVLVALLTTHIICLAELFQMPPNFVTNMQNDASITGTLVETQTDFDDYGNYRIVWESFRVLLFAWYSLYMMVVCPQPQNECCADVSLHTNTTTVTNVVRRYMPGTPDEESGGSSILPDCFPCFKKDNSIDVSDIIDDITSGNLTGDDEDGDEAKGGDEGGEGTEIQVLKAKKKIRVQKRSKEVPRTFIHQ